MTRFVPDLRLNCRSTGLSGLPDSLLAIPPVREDVVLAKARETL
jgi:hypothetical protein